MVTARIARPLGWLVVGITIGALAASSSQSVAAQRDQNTRLVFTTASNSTGASTVFIRDTESKACWFAIGTASGVFSGVAPAPPDACR